MDDKTLRRHYYVSDLDSPPTETQIPAAEIKSNQLDMPGSGRPNVASWPWGNYEPRVEDGWSVTRTANNKYYFKDSSKQGAVTQDDDYQIYGMKKAGEDVMPAKFDLMPATPSVMYASESPLRMNFPNVRDTATRLLTSKEIYIGPINNTGFNASIASNVYLRLRDFLWKNGEYRDELLDKIEFLLGKGLKPKRAEGPVFGVGVSYDEKSLASYHTIGRYLMMPPDFIERIRKKAEDYDLRSPEELKAVIDYVLGHETILHGFFGIKGNRASEKLTGLLDEESYENLASKYAGTKWNSIYRKLAQIGRDYAELHSPWHEISNAIRFKRTPKKATPFEKLIKSLEAEADAYDLASGDKVLYVKWRLNQMFSDLRGEESSGLEAIVDESENVSFTINADRTLTPTYKGSRVYGEGASMPTRFIGKDIKEGGNKKGRGEKQYGTKVEESEYRNMNDVRDRESVRKGDQENPASNEAEPAEGNVADD
ncbi:MAG: hypothetical protein AABX33_05365 [Nanoarchaeota archaeon]